MAKEYVRIGDTIGTWIEKNNNLVNLVGDPAELLTDSAGSDSSLVYSINELHKSDSNQDSDIGNRALLETEDKTNLVSAINEVNTLATYFAVYQDSDIVIGKEQDTKLIIADSSITIEGDFRVKGSIIDEERFTDAYIVLNEALTVTDPPNALGGGVEVNRGSETQARLTWNETNDYWTAGLQGSEKRILTDSDIGIQIASKDSVDQGQDSNKALIDSANTKFIALGDSNKALIDSNTAYFESLVDSNFNHFTLLLDSSDGVALSINNSTAKIDSNATLGTFLKKFDKHDRFVIGDSNADEIHFPGLQPADPSNVHFGANSSGILARKSSFLELRNSVGAVQKRIIGFDY